MLRQRLYVSVKRLELPQFLVNAFLVAKLLRTGSYPISCLWYIIYGIGPTCGTMKFALSPNLGSVLSV